MRMQSALRLSRIVTEVSCWVRTAWAQPHTRSKLGASFQSSPVAPEPRWFKCQVLAGLLLLFASFCFVLSYLLPRCWMTTRSRCFKRCQTPSWQRQHMAGRLHSCGGVALHPDEGGCDIPAVTPGPPILRFRSAQGLAPLSEQEVDELLLFADPDAW